MENLTNEKILKILYDYETKKEYRRVYYRERYNNDPEFRKKKQDYQREYYHKTKNNKKENNGVNILASMGASKED
jgi:hypothetical protein